MRILPKFWRAIYKLLSILLWGRDIIPTGNLIQKIT